METIQTATDLYNFEYRMQNATDLLQRANTSDANKKLIEDFISHLADQGMGLARRVKFKLHLKVTAENFGKDFVDGDRKDAEKFVRWLRDSGYAPNTFKDYVSVYRRLFRFIRCGVDDEDTPYPDEVKWMKKLLKPKAIEHEELKYLTGDEVEAMIRAADNDLDRAMLSVGYEVGLRASELLLANVGDIHMGGARQTITVRGRTGERTIRLISSVAHLSRYLETHPKVDNPSFPLWCTKSPSWKDRRLGYIAWARRLKKLANKAGVLKPIHNHMLRHGSATRSSQFLLPLEMCKLYGWSPNSKMPATYAHLSGIDIDGKLEVMNAGKPLVPPRSEFVAPTCPRCGERSSPGLRYCGKCGTTLVQKELFKSMVDIEETRSAIHVFTSIIDAALATNPPARPQGGPAACGEAGAGTSSV